MTGIEESVEGIVTFYTYEIPEYSFFDHRRNTEATVMATTMAVALPMSTDHLIYHEEGICFIKLSENLVEVFEDRVAGLSRTLYSKPKSGEED